MWAFQIIFIETIPMAKKKRPKPNKVLLLLLKEWTVDSGYHRTIRFPKHPAHWHKVPLYFVKQRYLKEKKSTVNTILSLYHLTP